MAINFLFFLPSIVGGMVVTATAAVNDKHHSTACNMVHVRAHTDERAAAVTPTGHDSGRRKRSLELR